MEINFDQYIKSERYAAKNKSNISIQEQNDEIITKALCDILSYNSNKFDDEFDSIIKFIKQLKGKRLLYSVISGYVFSLSSNNNNINIELDNLATNVDKLKSVVTSNRYHDSIRDTVIKLYDHIHLAIQQATVFKLNKEDFENLISESKQINSKFESFNSQILSIVALFTAMAFLVFGGLASFESIFSNMDRVPIIKLVPISAIWGLGILNIISLFIFFICKITGKNFKHNDSSHSSLFKRYPYFILGNYILILIFIISSWYYSFVSNFDLNVSVENLFCNSYWNAKRYFIIALLLIVITIIIVLSIAFFKKKNIKS